MRQPWLILMCLLALLATLGCNAEEGDSKQGGFAFENTIFTGTSRFNATANIPNSSAPGKPSFSWSASGRKHVITAIFSERIQVTKNRITNANKIVWLWHSGVGKGREGNILYDHGVRGENDPRIPDALPPGTYYWAVWMIDDSGNPVLSTIEYSMTVK